MQEMRIDIDDLLVAKSSVHDLNEEQNSGGGALEMIADQRSQEFQKDDINIGSNDRPRERKRRSAVNASADQGTLV